MPENILIAIAWPYANAEIHVGNNYRLAPTR